MKPILFNTGMVREILGGRKTVTRRVVNPQPDNDGVLHCTTNTSTESLISVYDNGLSPYRSGDILYVRETFLPYKDIFYYKADDKHLDLEQLGIRFKWHPSIHMPKEAARIFLRVTDVRVERLQDITEEQAKAEGIEFSFRGPLHWHIFDEKFNGWFNYATHQEAFKKLWDSTIKKQNFDKYGWSANPWVWVIEFEGVEKGAGQ